MSATSVAASLAFRARVTGTRGLYANRSRLGACDPRQNARTNTRRAVRAEAARAEAKKEQMKEVKKKVKKEETKSETTVKDLPAPPAAPSGYERDIKRLEKAGVEIHKFGTAYLDDGKNNDEVRELQRFLKGTGHYNYNDGATGYFGPMTQEAVKKWQDKYSLPQSGGWGIQSRATYLQVKHAELRAMQDPEAAASWSKSAVATGLLNKNTGLPIPPSIGDARFGEAKPAWVASANTGSSLLPPAAKSKLMASGYNTAIWALLATLTAITGVKLFTRGSNENSLDARRAEYEKENGPLPGFQSDAGGEIVDVRAWHKDDDDNK